MKKILFIMLIAFGMMAQAQTFNEKVVRIHTDTTILQGGEQLIRDYYSFLPKEKSDGDFEFTFHVIWIRDGEFIVNESETFEGKPSETIVIGGVTRTFQQVYDLIITINESNWIAAGYQIYLQKIYNQ